MREIKSDEINSQRWTTQGITDNGLPYKDIGYLITGSEEHG